MTSRKVVSREYKVMLRAGCFKGGEASLLRNAGKFWRLFRKSIGSLAVECSGNLSEVDKRRLIRFYDTKRGRFEKNGYIFRERVEESSGVRQVTLKFRHADRYVSQDRNMDTNGADPGKVKFEEDIKPVFQTLYSFSASQKISAEKSLDKMEDPGRLYPGIPEALDKYREDERIAVVGGFTARELVLTGAHAKIQQDPAIEAECALVIWYDADGSAKKPVVVEFSFRYGNGDGEYGGETAKRAHDIFQVLQGKSLKSWTHLKSSTKTAFIQGLE